MTMSELKNLKITDMNNLELLLEEEDCESSDLTSKNVGGEFEALTNSRRRKVLSKLEPFFPHLQYLEIHDCDLRKVRALPSSLVELKLTDCRGLFTIRGLCGLAKLQILEIANCQELDKLPRMETLISLEVLKVGRCFENYNFMLAMS